MSRHRCFIPTPYFSFRVSHLVPSSILDPTSPLCVLSNVCLNIITPFHLPGIPVISLLAPPRSDTIFGCPAIAVEKASDANTIFQLPVITVARRSHPKTPSSHHPCTQVRNSDTIFRVPPIALPLNFRYFDFRGLVSPYGSRMSAILHGRRQWTSTRQGTYVVYQRDSVSCHARYRRGLYPRVRRDYLYHLRRDPSRKVHSVTPLLVDVDELCVSVPIPFSSVRFQAYCRKDSRFFCTLK